MPIFTIEVSGAELEVITLAIGRMPDAKPVRARAGKYVEPFHPDTGDSRLDAFMRASRQRRGAPKAAPTPRVPAFPFGLKRMTRTDRELVHRFNEDAIRAWRALGYTVTIDRLPGDSTPRVAIDGRNVTITKERTP